MRETELLNRVRRAVRVDFEAKPSKPMRGRGRNAGPAIRNVRRLLVGLGQPIPQPPPTDAGAQIILNSSVENGDSSRKQLGN
jgi:hypothetical protein